MIRLRAARIEDARAIARIYVAGWRDAYPGLVPDRVLLDMSRDRQAIAWAGTIAGDRSRGLVRVAVEDNRVVGFGSAGRSRFAALPFAGEIFTLYVDQAARDRGVGRALLLGLFEALARSGQGSAVIWVLAANPARHFYAAQGGRLVARWSERQWGVDLDQAAYGWPNLAAVTAKRSRAG